MINKRAITTLPPDLYSRNYIISEGIRAYKKNRKIRVLDVGGRNGGMELFLDNEDELVLIDIREGDEPNLIVGDATDMHMFQDNAFDIVTSGDVFEHIPIKKREQFMKECLRVSKDLVVLAAPFNDTAVLKEEKEVGEFFESLVGHRHEWLKEHLENGLPDKTLVKDFIKNKGLFFKEFFSNDLENWQLAQLFIFYAYNFGMPKGLVENFYATYNGAIRQCEDPSIDFYRSIFFITKKRSIDFNFSYEFEPNKKSELRQMAFELISKHSIEQIKQKETHIQNLDKLLGAQKGQIQTLEQSVTQKETHIQNLQGTLLEKDQVIQKLLISISKKNENVERLIKSVEASFAKNKELKIVFFRGEYGLREMAIKIENLAENVNRLKRSLKQKEQHIRNTEPAWRELQLAQKSFLYRLSLLGRRFAGWRASARKRVNIFFKAIPFGLEVLFREGPSAFLRKLKLYIQGDLPHTSINNDYQRYLQKIKFFNPPFSKIKKTIGSLHYQPKISIIIPVYNVKQEWLNKCIGSVRSQFYQKWELCLYDDASTNKETIKCLEVWQEKDPRIKVKFGTKNQHISGASNDALKMATGDFIGLLDNDDEITPDALYEVVKALNKNKDLDFIYSDEDKLDMDGNLCDPHFKSDFNLDLLLGHNYICHFTVIRKSIGDRVGWFRKGYEGSQDYDLFLRIIEKTQKIYHIPKVLYHWRKIPGSTAAEYSEKSYCYKTSLKALTDYMHRNKILGEVKKGITPNTFRVERTVIEKKLISIIVPFKDRPELMEQLLKSIKQTTYKNYELLLISNNSSEKKVFEVIKKYKKYDERIHLFEYNVPFNYSEINNWAVKKAKGEYILLLNNDIEVIEQDWLREMVSHIQRKEVGAVGAKLLYPNDKIQHAGIIMGIGGVAGHSHKYLPDPRYGYFSRPHLIQDLSGCTAACLLTRRDVYEKVGRLNENELKIAFNDVDFCLKIRKAGYLIVYTPYAKLYHHESISRGSEDTPEKKKRFERECGYMYQTWGETLKKDPYYNPNLTLEHEDFGINI